MNTAVEAEAVDVRFFDLTSRIGRLLYLAYGMRLALLGSLALGVCVLLIGLSPVLGYAGVAVVCVGWVVMSIGFAVRRLHDMDKSGWLMLLMIVPLVDLIMAILLIFAPGSDGENRFGPPPPPNSGWVIAAAVCYIGIIPLAGIMAAIAISGYADYTPRNQTSEGVSLAGGAEVDVSEYYLDHQSWPDRLESVYAAAAQKPAGRFVDSVIGHSDGAQTYGVVASFKAEGTDRRVAGTSLELWTTDGGNTWHCGPGGPNPVDPKYLNPGCREGGAP